MRKWLDHLYRVSGIAAAIGILAVLLLMLVVSGGRNIAVNIASADDVVGFLVAAVATLGLAYTFKSGEIIRVNLLLEALPSKARRVFEIAALGLGTVLVGFFAWRAAVMACSSWQFGATTSGVVALPIWPVQVVFCFGIGVFFVALADEFIIVCAGRKPSYQTPAANPAEHEYLVTGGL